jgi:hypothetical protein
VTTYDSDPCEDADRAKRCYAKSTEMLALMHHRLAELAGSGRLEPEESMLLQEALVTMWEEIYCGTLVAVVDGDASDSGWNSAGNTDSDGRQIIHKVRVVAEEDLDNSWKHNRYLLRDGAILEFPLGTVAGIASLHADGPSDGVEACNEDLKRRLQTPVDGWDAV